MERIRVRNGKKGKNHKRREDDARGGNRFGAGRRPGSKNKSTAEIRAAAAASGELPHQFMLRVARTPVGSKIDAHVVTWEDVKWACEKCANFFAAKITATELSGPGGGPLRIFSLPPELLRGLPESELVLLEKTLMRLAGGNGMKGQGRVASASAYAATLNGNGHRQ